MTNYNFIDENYEIINSFEKLNRETIKYFDLKAVKLVDVNDNAYYGYLVCRNKHYILLPLNDKFITHSFKLSAIKSLMHLTNYVRLSR